MAIFNVTNTNDSGDGSLRDAIALANSTAGADTIDFTGSVFTDATPDIITLTSGDLKISDALTILGTGANQLTVSGNNTSGIFSIFSRNRNVTIDALTIANGNTVVGAGIVVQSTSTLNLTNSTVSGNQSLAGGGILIASGTANIINSTISGNTATGPNGGGGILIGNGRVNITNSTISSNTTTNSGGGISIGGGTVSLNNSTITNNIADADNNDSGDGGGISISGGTATVTNSIIAGNFDAANEAPDIFGEVTGNANNLIGSTTGASGTIGTGSDIVNPNPGLAPLANNGGTTQTQALLPGSPAINAGNNANVPSSLTTDQRGAGFTRIEGEIVDIGAYEFLFPGANVNDTPGNDVDILNGFADNNTLDSGEGKDILTGGTSADIFVLNPNNGWDNNGKDTLTDFNPAEGDKIGLAEELTYNDLAFSDNDILVQGSALVNLNLVGIIDTTALFGTSDYTLATLTGVNTATLTYHF